MLRPHMSDFGGVKPLVHDGFDHGDLPEPVAEGDCLGASGAVPVLLAAWGPPASAVLLALGLLLHFEDG